MPINLFQFDWIIIDTVVIILLIVFLVSVKIFKERFRWRSTLSNIALEQFIFDKQSLELTNQNIIVKNISITVNNVLKSKNMLKPSIVIFRSTKNKRLVKVLTEGLASYGFDVINITLNIKSFDSSESIKKQIQEEFNHLISSVLNFFKQKQLITNSSYLTINYHKSKVFLNSIIYDKNNAGMILINPKFEIIDQKKIAEIIDKKEVLSKLFIIFSENSSTFLTNKNLNKFLTYLADYNSLKSNLLIVDKSKSSFKYYETILLGIIINLIESNILKSQVLS
jgi:hypothetical protein